ncbi:EamA family transporter [Crocinitomix catalasitica]|uniref:EamA family transporter n=1 Tax=Crocinitomix catalasitica TaxID=184607 RepID=UPI0004853824|nr:EamA family transporter [Crocinitomix catalasitica]
MIKLKGIIYVVVGAASYGVLATFVKLANNDGLSTGGINFLQYFLGFVVLALLTLMKGKKTVVKDSLYPKLQLVLFGTTSGLTSYFYYLSIQYLPVSIAIILLMQAIWMGVVLEAILQKQISKIKLIGSGFVILGTMFAVNIFEQSSTLNLIGIVYGILASIAYTISLYASNAVALKLPNLDRSKYLILGGAIIVGLIWNTELLDTINFTDPKLWQYAIFLALFGAIIPPIAFNKGFPIIGIGWGSILTAIEIPVSITTAHLLLHEKVAMIQWLGVGIIIISIVMINYKNILKSNN